MSKEERDNKLANTRGICPVCYHTCVHHEDHPDCSAALKIKEVATSIKALLKGYKVYLREGSRLSKKLKSTYTVKEIKRVGSDLYRALVQEHNSGKLAKVHPDVVRLFTDMLMVLAKLLRKTVRFQGNVCLVPE